MKTIIVDGLSGSGKWVIARSLCCIKEVCSLSIDENLEHIINYNSLSPNTDFEIFFKQYLNVLNYKKFIGRNINNRISDLTYSGIYPFPKVESISKYKEGKISLIKSENKINIYETHGGALIGLSNELNKFIDEIVLIKIKRNPLDFIQRWCAYVHRYGTDIFETTLFYKYGKQNLPFFVKNYEQEFILAKTSLEKVTVIFKIMSEKNKNASLIASKQKNYFEIDFDDFIIQPSSFIELILKKFKHAKIDEKTKKIIFEELQIPRLLRIKEFGYWKLSNKFDFKKLFSEMRPKYKLILSEIIDEYSSNKIIL